jgi:hypothetical protein
MTIFVDRNKYILKTKNIHVPCPLSHFGITVIFVPRKLLVKECVKKVEFVAVHPDDLIFEVP